MPEVEERFERLTEQCQLEFLNEPGTIYDLEKRAKDSNYFCHRSHMTDHVLIARTGNQICHDRHLALGG